jgi:nucleoside-triphosphatase THEP1
MMPAATLQDGVEDPEAGPHGRLLVVTGDSGSGKSTLCRQVARAAREAGLSAHGVAGSDQPGDGRVTRWQEDLRSGQRVLLGRMATPEAIAAGASRWDLDDAALDWCGRILTEACPADLLVIDEVGPLELEHGRGILKGARRALSGRYGVALVVVRPRLVGPFTELFASPPPKVIDVREVGVLGRLTAAILAREPS